MHAKLKDEQQAHFVEASDSLRPADPIASERQANGVGGGLVLTTTIQDLYSSIAQM